MSDASKTSLEKELEVCKTHCEDLERLYTATKLENLELTVMLDNLKKKEEKT